MLSLIFRYFSLIVHINKFIFGFGYLFILFWPLINQLISLVIYYLRLFVHI